MAGDEVQGVLTEDNVLPHEPSEIAEDLAATRILPTETPTTLREDQIQNAMSFLNHPKVRGSSKESKVSFLEKKGLTSSEIEEAFKRVPEVTSASSDKQGQLQTTTSPPSRPFPVASQATLSAIQPGHLAQQYPQSVRWTQVVIGASVVVAGAYALKQLVGPYAAKVYRKVYGIDETPEQSKQRAEDRRTADLVATAIQSQTSELRATVESLKAMVAELDKVNRPASPPAEVGISVADLRAELHAFASTLGEFDGREGNEGDNDLKGELRDLKHFLNERLPERLQPAPPVITPHPSPHKGSNGLPAVQQVAPPASRAPHMQERKPEETPTQPPHPPSYMEVLEMLERGETPPNVRSDINDQPPNPSQPPPSTRLQPRAKPWERNQAAPSSPALNGDVQSVEVGQQVSELVPPSNSSTPSKADVWRPPPVPKPSLKTPGSSASLAAGDGDE